MPNTKNITIKNLKLIIKYKGNESLNNLIAIYNCGYNFKIENSIIEIHSENSINIFGICNNNEMDTHMQTKADNLILCNNTIKINIYNKNMNTNNLYGIYNYLANSIQIFNNYIYVNNKGYNYKQKSVGLYTNGRYGRIINNNIKANAGNSKGDSINCPMSVGIINEGLYTLIEANNIISEWSSYAIGFYNKSQFANLLGNKILTTHSLNGIIILSKMGLSDFSNNMLISTAKNTIGINHNGSDSIINGNIIRILNDEENNYFSIGVLFEKVKSINNIIKDNVVNNVVDNGIFLPLEDNVIRDNIIKSYKNKYIVEIKDLKYDETIDVLKNINLI